MSTLAISLTRAARALLMAGLLTGALTVVGTSTVRAEQTSAEFSEKYNAGVSAYKAKDLAKALGAAKEARGVAKSGFEKTAALKLIVAIAGASGKYADEADALEQLLASDSLSGAEKPALHKALAGAYGQLNKRDKAVVEMKEAMKGGGSAADYDTLATLYFGARDCRNGLEALDKALAGGKEPNEQQLKAKDVCYFQLKDARLLATAEELMRRFPKKDWYNQVLAIYQEKKIDDMAILAMLRYGFERDYLDNEVDFLKLADRALDVGTTAEAQRVLEKAIAKKVIKKMEKADGLLKQAKDRAAEDAKTTAQLDAEAHAGKNGDTDVRLGLRYFSMKQYDKAVDALQRGLSADRVARVKRPDDANMVLGISLLKLNKKADAEKAFNAAKADARMTAAAKMWLGA
jgi:tetratricopeptide (TPR) repeat protein